MIDSYLPPVHPSYGFIIWVLLLLLFLVMKIDEKYFQKYIQRKFLKLSDKILIGVFYISLAFAISILSILTLIFLLS